MDNKKRILVTGACGYIGYQVASYLSKYHTVVGIDLNLREASFNVLKMDIRDPGLSQLVAENKITHIVHLASVVGSTGSRELDYDIDVNGTENVLQACIANDVRHLTITSSGAAYGYHKDNPEWLEEQDALRGNVEFAYSHHKRLVEERLIEVASSHPELQQLILRPGTVLGANTRNLITRLFEAKSLLAVKGSASPFVFIWDQDVVSIIAQGVNEDKTGYFNLAGDGAMTIDEIAEVLNKPVRRIPAWLIAFALSVGKRLGITQYGPEQVNFLRYRPVLNNRRLKEDFGYTPKKTSSEVFAEFAKGLNNE